MSAVLDGAGPPPSPSSPDDDGEYRCDCPGFKDKTVERMCLRCLAAYAEGLPFVLSGGRLVREMDRVAMALKRHLKTEIKAIRTMTVADALRAVESPFSEGR